MVQKEYDICIVGGAGRVGLPLGIAMADRGQNTVLYDLNENALKMLAEGCMPFLENGAEEVLIKVLNNKLAFSSERKVIAQSRFVVIVVGTPVDEHLNPQFAAFRNLFEDISDLISDDQHIILRSTVYPGTTEKIKQYLTEIGKKTKLSFCPERIAEGKAMEELYSLPQIVASFDGESQKEAAELFRLLTPDILFLNPKEAELAKLFTNVWRYIQFAVSNQFYQIADLNGLDFYRIRDAMTYKYPRVQSFPGAGFAAGPCLFKDTMQLAAFHNNNFFIGHAAMLANEGLPNYIVQKLKEKYDLMNKTVGILGMAFKANSDDKRESLSYKLMKMLEMEAKKVLCTDVYIEEEGFVTVDQLIEKADVIVLAAGHEEYSNLKIRDDQVLIDVWNFFGKGGLI
jgi:UDP-N-acetyl-D-mannosaminuronic acid dehydrogenase